MNRSSKWVAIGRACGGTLLLALSILLLSCTGNPLNIRQIAVTENPTEQISMLESRIAEVREARMDLLSPDWFGRAQASYEEARKLRDEGDPIQKIMDAVARSHAQLDRAAEFAAVSKTAFPTVIKARDDARAAGAPTLGERYAEVEDSFLSLTRAIESDDLAWAKRRAPSVEQAFRGLELSAIQEQTEHEIRSLIEQAEQDNAPKLAPTALAEAKRQHRELTDFISKNRYASEEIGERANAALFSAARAVAVTRRARELQSRSPERLTLDDEAFMNSLREALSIADIRDQPFPEQRQRLVSAATELIRDRDYLVSQAEKLRSQIGDMSQAIAQLEGQSEAERAELARLDSERRFNELYNEVSRFFDNREAQVYKQEQQLVIRLRALQFPVGKYVLMPESYALLSKVQKAIRAFGEPQVTIEGHTDSTGSAQLNEHLSQLRADAVAEYLVANNTLPRARIRSTGKGFSEPLADNKTTEGRALNRRIDVIIDARHGA